MLEFPACRVKYDLLPKLIEDISLQVLNQTTLVVKELIGNIDTNILVEWIEANDFKPQHPLHLIGAAYTILETNILRPASTSNTLFSLDASLQIFLYRGFAYVVLNLPKTPEGPVYTTPLPEYAENYSFKFGSPRPDNLSRQQWRSRRLRWEKLEDLWGSGIKHLILSYGLNIRTEEIRSRIKEEYVKANG